MLGLVTKEFAVRGVLGTTEHERLINELGSPWWGWWNRDDEGEKGLLLSLPTPLWRVPNYYRDRAKDFPAWFELVRLEQSEFDPDLIAAKPTP